MTDWREGSEMQTVEQGPTPATPRTLGGSARVRETAGGTPFAVCIFEPSLPRERGSGRGRPVRGASPPILALGVGRLDA